MRSAVIERNTAETEIRLSLHLDGGGESAVQTGCGFLDHMLTLFSAHAGFSLDVACRGDARVDYHHTTEDIGIVLGSAFRQALGNCGGINRYGFCMLPMDEALVETTADISGRAWLSSDVRCPTEKVGDFDTELCEEFLRAFVRTAGITLHVRQLRGSNSHHILEAVFKGLGRALRQAAAIDPSLGGAVPSTKGML
ncbi:MAG TPA: imidazoleglycerol-phosphate dehydratase HisB [Clostridiales bacterium]|nr:imidazoleglycerol-phosphate dehydratase HisB [Clostridiales bacterium]HBR09379.1 imidazoleglycerol-phosphate dehydratase HisB [Clostridiales bacterium]